MKILGNDLIPGSEITNADDIDTADGHPIENVQDARLSHAAWIAPEGFDGAMYARSMYNQTLYTNFAESGSTIIDFDLGTTYSFDTFALAGNNFTNIDYTITWALVNIAVPDGTVHYLKAEPEWTTILPLAEAPVSARYVRLVIADAQQTRTFLEIGRISVGLATTMPGIRPIYDVDHISNANRSLSKSRQLYGGPVVIYRRVNVSFPEINSQAELLEFFRDVDLYNPFYVQFDDECPMPEPNMYSTLAEDTLAFNYNEARFYTSRLSFVEVF